MWPENETCYYGRPQYNPVQFNTILAPSRLLLPAVRLHILCYTVIDVMWVSDVLVYDYVLFVGVHIYSIMYTNVNKCV